MAAPNMALIAASLERSFQNCSLNNQHSSSSSASSSTSSTSGGDGGGGDSTVDVAATPLELNSETALPYHWEQCLDLKTGEIYYINWRTGMKVMEDPRTAAAYGGVECYSEEDSSAYDSEESSSESSPSSSTEQCSGNNNNPEGNQNQNLGSTNVLVVAGCKSCLMYYMVPKQLGICPKCSGQLLHFDTGSSPTSSSS